MRKAGAVGSTLRNILASKRQADCHHIAMLQVCCDGNLRSKLTISLESSLLTNGYAKGDNSGQLKKSPLKCRTSVNQNGQEINSPHSLFTFKMSSTPLSQLQGVRHSSLSPILALFSLTTRSLLEYASKRDGAASERAQSGCCEVSESARVTKQQRRQIDAKDQRCL